MIKVKVCGITRLEDAEEALGLGADELGFVLAPSPRRIAAETVRAILVALRSGGRAFRAIGVFVNESPGAMRGIVALAGLDAVQIHGDESPADCAAIGRPGVDAPGASAVGRPGLSWYRALRIGSAEEAARLVGLGWECPRILADALVRGEAGAAGSYGGTGERVGAEAALAARAAAKAAGKEFFLAGGLRPENIAEALALIRPDGVDVSSGVEESPGIKSRLRLEAFFRELRGAENSIAAGALARQGS
jgi:phosphoribosylanthranilate isomerase